MSLAVRVIPCLDVDAGRVVKGVNFENLRDAGDPVELARRYNAAGADEITFLDVTASTSDRATTYDVVTRTAEEVFIPLTVGGGVRAVEDVDRLLDPERRSAIKQIASGRFGVTTGYLVSADPDFDLARARLDGGHHVRLGVVGGQDEHRRPARLHKPAGQLDAGRAGHLDVGDHHVHPVGHLGVAVGGLGDAALLVVGRHKRRHRHGFAGVRVLGHEDDQAVAGTGELAFAGVGGEHLVHNVHGRAAGHGDAGAYLHDVA